MWVDVDENIRGQWWYGLQDDDATGDNAGAYNE
jgi:hypothetical protein